MNKPDPFDAELDALFAEARKIRPNTSAAQHAFETRLWANLRTKREKDSIWTMALWRLMPFFATCVVGLIVWQLEVASETSEAEQIAYTHTADSLDGWD